MLRADAAEPAPHSHRDGPYRGLIQTGALALLFLVGLHFAIARTAALDRPLSIEHTLDLREVGNVQTLQVLRRLWAGPADRGRRVVLLGDSRLWFAARQPAVQAEVAQLAPDLDVTVENMALFGARIGDFEVLSRYLDRLQPSLVVIALGGEELFRNSAGHLATRSARVLDVGWADGALPPVETGGRLDRWLRTAWPLYRERALLRMTLADRLFPTAAPPRPFPDQLTTLHEFFRFRYGDRAQVVTNAHSAFTRQRTLEGFVRYLRAAQAMMHGRPEGPGEPRVVEDTSRRLLDVLLDRVGRGPWASRVVLLPQNPLLEDPTSTDYRMPELNTSVIPMVVSMAERHAVPVVDARGWVAAWGFFDFVHVFPNLRDFQEPFSRALVDALRPPGAERRS